MTVKDAMKNFKLPFEHLNINDSTLHNTNGGTKHFDFDYPPDTFDYKDWLEDYGDSELIYLFYNPSENDSLTITI